MNKEFLHMQMLAGVITPSQYNALLNQSKPTLSGIIKEGFLDNVAASIKGKSEQGKLAQEILAKYGITKNPSEIFTLGIEKGGTDLPNEVQSFVKNGGDLNTKIPFSDKMKSAAGGAIFKETYTFDFNKDVPTMKSSGRYIWNIKDKKWEKWDGQGAPEVNAEEPMDIEAMKNEQEADPGTFATEATMMTIADAAKVWPGPYGKRLRDIIAEKTK
jgi:hypothetical protein